MFLRFFEDKGHQVVSSSPVIPADDPTLLFTNAGMNQFKDIFLGRKQPESPRAASVQKCMRASGKHNDLEDVGRDGRHHTFFEMLGNWSFGDYYKREAILWGWEFVTRYLELPPESLWASVYKDDDEAYRVWVDEVGLPAGRVVRLGDLEQGDEENFWSMGETGPCGPCSEIYYRYPVPGEPDFLKESEEGTILELWNLVFMEFNREEDGRLVPLPQKHIDTGMGLERAAAVLRGVQSNYQTDLFIPIIQATREITNADPEHEQIAFRVIADHIRALVFSITDGAMPSNEGRGYVIRRILRRAVRYGRRLGMNQPFLHRLAETVVDTMAGAYPEIEEHRPMVESVIRNEEELFHKTLEKGLEEFEQAAVRARSSGRGIIPGNEAFVLHDTYGFPFDLTRLMAREQGLEVEEESFHRAMEEQRERARRDSGFQAAADAQGGEWTVLRGEGPTVFLGYERETVEDMRLIKYRRDGSGVQLVFDQTPFYAESGGQVGDTGVIAGDGTRISVQDVRKSGDGQFVHIGTLESGEPADIPYTGTVESRRRRQIRANHTATHLLQAALVRTIGDQARQAGSLVAPDRLRFDFTQYQPLTGDELQKIEDLVNEWVLQDLPVTVLEDVPLERAREMGAMALFGEKYGETVRVINIEGVSAELCGGTHAGRTSEIGLFTILREGSISSGVRRIEAATHTHAYRLFKEQKNLLHEIAETAGTDAGHLPRKISQLNEEIRDLQKKLKQQRKQSAGDQFVPERDLEPAGPFKAGLVTMGESSPDEMRELADGYRARVPEGVFLMVARSDGKTSVLLSAGDQAVEKGVHAGKLLGSVLGELGGRGGGRPHLAQGGGIDAGRAPEAFEKIRALLAEKA
jgi:alanyl-tRNA synthetase